MQSTQKSNIHHWENLRKQVEKHISSFPQLESHPIYQSTIWEVQLAQSVIDFVAEQKNLVKNWSSKFNLDKNQNYAEFRNKLTKGRIQAMLDQAERSKIELSEEIRALRGWLADYDKFSDQFNTGALLQNLSLERLKDILKAMYVSPINYDEMYFKMKDRIDTVDMIRIKLKQVMEEHE